MPGIGHVTQVYVESLLRRYPNADLFQLYTESLIANRPTSIQVVQIYKEVAVVNYDPNAVSTRHYGFPQIV